MMSATLATVTEQVASPSGFGHCDRGQVTFGGLGYGHRGTVALDGLSHATVAELPLTDSTTVTSLTSPTRLVPSPVMAATSVLASVPMNSTTQPGAPAVTETLAPLML